MPSSDRPCLFTGALRALASLALALPMAGAWAAPCGASVTFGVDFGASYACTDLGQPTGIPGSLGGLTFLDNNTLLIGGAANGSTGVIRQIDVVRDAGNHIIGFAGPSTPYAAAPFIDGGLAFGPGGVLFSTGYPVNTLMQFKSGSTTPDRNDLFTGVGGSVGALTFVPTGFAGAGQMKVVSYTDGTWYTVSLTPDGNGTFNFTVSAPLLLNVGRNPEGVAYIDGANDGFNGVDSVLVAEWASGRVDAFEVDANGDPIPASRRDFLSGLSGAEGAVIDPLTGDFLFSTFGGGDRVLVISGFDAPTPPNPGTVPTPSTLLLLASAALAAAGLRPRYRASSRKAATMPES